MAESQKSTYPVKIVGRVALACASKELADLPDVPLAPMLELADRYGLEPYAHLSVEVQVLLGALLETK